MKLFNAILSLFPRGNNTPINDMTSLEIPRKRKNPFQMISLQQEKPYRLTKSGGPSNGMNIDFQLLDSMDSSSDATHLYIYPGKFKLGNSYRGEIYWYNSSDACYKQSIPSQNKIPIRFSVYGNDTFFDNKYLYYLFTKLLSHQRVSSILDKKPLNNVSIDVGSLLWINGEYHVISDELEAVQQYSSKKVVTGSQPSSEGIEH